MKWEFKEREMLRTVCGIAVIFVLVWVASVFADEHLLFYATFDENAGDVVKDHSQYKHEGKYMNGAKWSPEGKYGGCAEIRADLAHVNVPHHDMFNITDTITMEAWVSPDVLRSRGIIIQKVENYCLWFMNSGQLRVSDDQREALDADYPFEAGQWHHLAAILDTVSPKRQIYIDGKLVAQDAVAFTMDPSTYSLQMGHKQTSPGVIQYKGLIDEVRIWNTVRTEAEINGDMESTPAAVLPADKLTTTWGQLKTK